MFEQQLQDHLARMRAGEPLLPVLSGIADAQAARLRRAGLTYGAIAVVMRVYHGHDRSEGAWRYACRKQGVPGRHYLNGNERRVIRGGTGA